MNKLEIATGSAPRGGAEQSAPAPGTELSPLLAYTDIGNAVRFADRWDDDLRYVVETQAWLRWDGRRWTEATRGDLLRAADAVVRGMVDEAFMMAHPAGRKDALAWATKSAAAGKLDAMISLAAAQPRLEVRLEQLDRNPFLLTCGNGTLDLRAGVLRPHRREDLITRWTPVDYRPEAAAPRWERFLAEIFSGDENLIAFVRRAVGYALTGSTREHALLLLHGSGANGKSVLLSTLRALLGDLAEVAAIETFLARERDAGNASPDLAKLAGARLVIATESEAGARLAEGTIKSLTGGDAITARRLYREPFTFTPQFKLILATNHRPNVRGTDDGIWRRLRLVPFEVSFRDREDKTLADTLTGELPGVLAWAVRGCMEWQAEGLGTAEAVSKATEDYRSGSDTVGAFIADRLALDPDGWISNECLTAIYEKWAEAQGDEPMKPHTIKRLVAERPGIRRDKHGGARGLRGIRELSVAEQAERNVADLVNEDA